MHTITDNSPSPSVEVRPQRHAAASRQEALYGPVTISDGEVAMTEVTLSQWQTFTRLLICHPTEFSWEVFVLELVSGYPPRFQETELGVRAWVEPFQGDRWFSWGMEAYGPTLESAIQSLCKKVCAGSVSILSETLWKNQTREIDIQRARALQSDPVDAGYPSARTRHRHGREDRGGRR